MRWTDSRLTSSAPWLVAGALVATPLVLAFCCVYDCAVDVRYWDEWEGIPILQHSLQGKLTFADLFHQHNEHRIFLPRLVMLAIERLTHDNRRTLILVSFGVLALAAAVLLLEHFRMRGATARALLEFAPVAWLVLSLRQWENLLWGWQIQIFMCVLFLVTALAALRRASNKRWLATALFCGVASTFSFSNGLLVWPAGLLLIGTNSRVRSRRTLFVWCGTGMLSTWMYFFHYNGTGLGSGLVFALRNPITAAYYFLSSVGGPISLEPARAATVGALLLGMGSLLLIRRTVSAPSMAVPLIVFSLGTSAMMMVGRASFGPGQSLASRYATLTVLGLVGLYWLAIEERSVAAVTALVAVVAVAQPIIISRSLLEAKAQSLNLSELAANLRLYQQQPDDNLQRLYPSPTELRERTAFLEVNRLSVFRVASPPPALLPLPPVFALDEIDGAASAPPPAVSGPLVTVAGWAVDSSKLALAQGVEVAVDGRYLFEARYNFYRRPDVARALGCPACELCGFRATIATGTLAKGRHTLVVRVIDLGGATARDSAERYAFTLR